MSTLSAFYKGGSITVCGDGQVIFAMEANALAFNEPLGADFRLSDNMLSKNQLLLFERIGFEECEKLRIAHARQKGLPEKEIRRIANEIRYSQARGEIPCYVISAYVSDGQLYFYLGTDRSLYVHLIPVRRRAYIARLNRLGLSFLLISCIYNPLPLPIKKVVVSVGGMAEKEISVPIFERKTSFASLLSRGAVQSVRFSLEELDEFKLDITNYIYIRITVGDDRDTVFQVKIPRRDRIIERTNLNYYYIPFRRVRHGEIFYQLRRDRKASLVLCKRGVNPVENTFSFKLLDSNFLSMFIYFAARIVKKFQRKKVNIFFEKFSQKCDEGGYDLFLMASDSPNSVNYFIMEETAPDYSRIKDVKNVLRKFSLPYYWAVFRSDYIISTDTPTHIGLIRMNNIWVKKITYDSPFFMLQHGVTYLKAHEKNSTYVYGKQYSPAYMVAGSEKEKRAISDMLMLKDDQILITGLPIFSRLKYNHITPSSRDIATIMLTWKPYEEQLRDYEETTYFKYTLGLYDILSRFLDPENILIVPHPVIADQLRQTAMKDRIYTGSVFSALEKSKLLVTDYSSVCYNVFYQGGAVIFHQEDLTYYEMANGPLVPADDEYIGYRTFSMEQFEELVRRTIVNGQINLAQLRTEKHRENALSINQFTDGKNLERIYDEIKKRGII